MTDMKWSGIVGFVNTPTNEAVRRILKLDGPDIPHASRKMPLLGPRPERAPIGTVDTFTRDGDAIVASGVIAHPFEGLTDGARVTIAIVTTEDPEWHDNGQDSLSMTFRSWEIRSAVLDLNDECSWPGSTLELT